MAEERITDGYKDSADIEWEAEKICRWAAARAGVIVVAPLVGTMTLMANEVYMITRLAELRGIKLSESAVLGLLGSLGATFVGQTLVTLIPFAPVQIPVGISVTYAVGKVANAWLKAGRPEDIAAFKEVYDDMVKRDYDDMHREIAPLKQAEDAVLADTTDCNLEESVELILKIVNEKRA